MVCQANWRPTRETTTLQKSSEKLKLKGALERQEGWLAFITPSLANQSRCVNSLNSLLPTLRVRDCFPWFVDEELVWPSTWSRLASHECHHRIQTCNDLPLSWPTGTVARVSLQPRRAHPWTCSCWPLPRWPSWGWHFSLLSPRSFLRWLCEQGHLRTKGYSFLYPYPSCGLNTRKPCSRSLYQESGAVFKRL